jgi:hypothetical protein
MNASMPAYNFKRQQFSGPDQVMKPPPLTEHHLKDPLVHMDAEALHVWTQRRWLASAWSQQAQKIP